MSVRRSLGISTISQLVGFLLGFVSVIIISRLLTPEEIGIYAVSVSVLGMAHVFREFGVSAYLIRVETLGKDQFRAAFAVALITSWGVAAVLFLARSPLAAFYKHEGVADVLILLALNFVVMPFGTPLLAVMRRELQFGRLAFISIISVTVQTSVTVGAAFAGESYMSMAWGGIAQHVVKALLLNLMRPGQVFVLPGFRGIREVLGFGSMSSLASLVGNLGSDAPSLILGRTLGFADVAFYSRALGLKRMTVDRVQAIVANVFFPTFAMSIRCGQNPAVLYSQAINHLFAIVGPALAFLALSAEPLIVVMFGDQWSRAAPLATLICLYSMIAAPYQLVPSSLTAVGKVGLVLRRQIVIQGIAILVLMLSVRLSLENVVRLLGIAYFADAVISQYTLKKEFGLGFQQLMHDLRGSLLLVVFSLAGPIFVVFGARFFGSQNESPLGILAICLVLALSGWLAGVFSLDHVMKAEIKLVINKVRDYIERKK